MKSKLDDKLLVIGYVDKAQADAHTPVKAKLHYMEINAAATKAYRKQFDHGERPLANNLLDSKDSPTGYSANVA